MTQPRFTNVSPTVSTRTAPFILPALLWGVALQLHLSALFIAPAMVLSIWFAGGRRGARLLLVAGTFLTSGVIPTFLPALFQIEELQSLAPLSRAVVGGRHWAVLLASFSTILVINLFALIGLVRITRRRGWSARGVLVWFWFTVPLAAVLLMDPDDFKPWHYAILSPAFPLLSGVGLRSIFRWLRRRPWIPDRLASALGVGGCTAALLALLVPAFLFQEGALAADFPGGAAGACSVWRQPQRPEAFGDILGQIKARIAPGSGERARFTGLSHDHLSGGLWCETRAARLDFWSPRREPGDLEVFLGFSSPAMEALGPGGRIMRAGGLHVAAPLTVLRPGFKRDPGRAVSGTFPLPPAPARYAVIHLEGDLGFHLKALRLRSGGLSLLPIHQERCSHWGLFVGQFTFALEGARHGSGPFRVELEHDAGVINYLSEVVFF